MALAAIASMPLVIAVAFMSADFSYMHFLYQGDIRDFAPGDALGVFLYAGVFASVPLVADLVFWIRVYRRVFEQVNR